ncbi:phosphocholine-specific phospholipase C [Segniliparus rugosus]|uniref:Phospholipase C, phosphocholine-specific n=1 Tax=Segniliparus rugosus (strain ATCC BAA-974 / DSM 45345 / CCUG 50838 / CIP 108380 / JCM 13579 / CDC 945) TaxID=679197 RepID=U1M185_SEGRC|nr:phospholipase C, phosphocholine-specific [Segniliparus rugosus]ERG69147.1 phospholipase C, phosphocholine-specific [Segniliparus rugosus ATCC BAA-974]
MSSPEPTRTPADLKHVVILMQENRSFDHYFGSLSGVRGFADKQVLEYPDGRSVFEQSDPWFSQLLHWLAALGFDTDLNPNGQTLRPFRMDSTKYNAQNADDLLHDWASTHVMCHNGAWNRWIAAKSPQTMGYFTRQDIPFQHALADAYTICDQYFCSLLGPTTPNRLYQWTATIDPAGRAGGPATGNPPDYQPVYRWSTYPEQLQQAGVSWQTYANDEVGDSTSSHPYVGDYGDNPLWLFQQYHDSLASTDPAARQLAIRGGLHDGWKPDSGQGLDTGHLLAQFIADCQNGALPQVSYIVAPYAWCEHPASSPNYGAHYIKTVIDAINSNEDIRRSTALILNFDENDGYFDHVLPPIPEPNTPDEFVNGEPIGYGVRVPLIVVSPWTRGGWVNSQVSDHTSIIRFLEQFTGVRAANISEWRREISGDLMSCFDFANPDFTVPDLPDTQALVAAADQDRALPAVPIPAAGSVPQPGQESEPARRKRPGAYLLDANIATSAGTVTVVVSNNGQHAAALALFPNVALDFVPTHLTVRPGEQRSWTWPKSADNYDISVYGPDGFLRRFFAKTALATAPAVTAASAGGAQPSVSLRLSNPGASSVSFTAQANDFTDHTASATLAGGSEQDVAWPLDEHGYYDVVVSTGPGFRYRFAGRVPV